MQSNKFYLRSVVMWLQKVEGYFMWLLWSDMLCICEIMENNVVNKFIK